jgi:hypothetical protein
MWDGRRVLTIAPPNANASRVAAVVVLAVVVGGILPTAAAAALADKDLDLLPDTFETGSSLTDPARADTDGDGLRDTYEDADRDGLTHRQEYVARTHPRRADTDGDGVSDANEDPDRDTLRNLYEFLAGTNPLVADSDGDGLRDEREDPDGEGLLNVEEQGRTTKPRDIDTDDDRWNDANEVRAATDPSSAASHPTAGGVPPFLRGAPKCPMFPASNVWNARVDTRATAANSATMISAIGLDRGLHMDFGSYAGYGIPYQVVLATTPRSTVAFDYDDESDHVGYPIPASPKIEGGSDRHILMVDRDACRLYELFAARKTSTGWRAGSGATWDLRTNALRPAGWTSADAAGLPILPGLVRYEEVVSGRILHALRFTTDRTRKAYIYPARHHASDSTSTSLPPMGLRVRLKASYDTSGFSPQARVIADALKRYGMILADNGSPWYISGASDPRFDDDVMHELDVITGRDLEVVDTTGLVNGP